MRTPAALLLFAAASSVAVRAVVPEPDNIIYGLVYAGTNQVMQYTAADTNVVIEARRDPAGPALASYTMGSKVACGDYYSVHLSLESVQPIKSVQAFQPGNTVYLTIVDPSGVRGQQSVVVGDRGKITRLDFSAGNFRADMLAYLKHPADNSPADNTISSGELDAYSTAWKSGQSWPSGPNPIPIAYATRAGTIWAGGGGYMFDPSQVSSAPTNAPAWWATNAPFWWASSVPATPVPGGSTVVRSVPSVFTPGTPMIVSNLVTSVAGVGVYAVEDTPPAGWLVSNISDGGRFDSVNQKVKWGLFFDNTPRALSYTITPPAGAATDVNFVGQASFDGQIVAIGGQDETGPPANPGLVTMSAAKFMKGVGYKIKMQGVPGDAQFVDMSTNLVNWTQITNIVMDSQGFYEFTDTSATNAPHRFYRTRAND